MRIPISRADFERGTFTRLSRQLQKVWPLGQLSLMQSHNVIAALFGYRDLHDAQIASAVPLKNANIKADESQPSAELAPLKKQAIAPIFTRDALRNVVA